MIHHSSLKAALEIALYDLRAQSMGVPLYQLLGGGDPQLKTDMTISLNDVDVMVRDALRAVEDGFDCLKIKVGGHTWQDDVDSVLAIERAVGARVALRLDANQGWTPKQAVLVIQAIEKAGDAKGQKQRQHLRLGVRPRCSAAPSALRPPGASDPNLNPSRGAELLHEPADQGLM